MFHVVLLPFLSLSIQPRGNPPYAQSFLLTRITYCPDNALCISEAIKLPRGFFCISFPASFPLSPSSRPSRWYVVTIARREIPEKFPAGVCDAGTAIHSCSVSHNSFREYNTKRIPRVFAENGKTRSRRGGGGRDIV